MKDNDADYCFEFTAREEQFLFNCGILLGLLGNSFVFKDSLRKKYGKYLIGNLENSLKELHEQLYLNMEKEIHSKD